MKCFVKENSLLARIAAWKLGVPNVAIVIGNTIHLHNAGKTELMRDIAWFRHEVAHLKQFRDHGIVMFMIKYVWETLKKGYVNNKYEVAARAAENDERICEDVVVI